MLCKNREYRILFIGNSYTYYNDMPQALFAPIVKAAGYEKVTVTSITKGGYYLEAHADPADEMGSQVEKALTENRYDYVVLQEQSVIPASDPERFFRAVRVMAQKVRSNGAKPVLYCTWGRKTGHKVLEEHGWTNETMTRLLAASYAEIGKELDAATAFVGPAFGEVYRSHGDAIELYDPDRTHPSAAGSYLAALTIFGQIFGVDPQTVDHNGPLSADDAAILKKAARNAAFG